MDIMETFTVNVTGGHWGLPVGAIAICSSIIVIVVNIAFAVAVFRDATFCGSTCATLETRFLWVA